MVDEAMRVRVIRAIVGISKSDLAARCDVVYQTVSNWETGRSVPNSTSRRVLSELCAKNNIAIRPDGFPVVGA